MRKIIFTVFTFTLLLQISNTYSQNYSPSCIDRLEAHYDSCKSADGWDKGCFKLANCNITDNDIFGLAQKMQVFSDKSIIDLSHNQLTSRGIKMLATMLPNVITDLDISYNAVDDEGVDALLKNQILLRLVANHNRIGNEGARAAFLNKQLLSLDLAYNQLTSESIPHDFYGNLRELDVSGNKLVANDLPRIVTLLYGDYNKPHLLAANDMNLGDKAARLVAENYKEAALYELKIELSNNNISDEGAKELAKIGFFEPCPQHPGYLSLVLNNNKIGKKGIENLRHNEYLIELDLANNDIDDETAFLIIRFFALDKLDLSHNKLSQQGVMNMIKRGIHVRKLFLDDINLGDELVIALVNSQPPLSHLQALSLRNTNLHDTAAYTLAKYNWNYLNIGYNHISKNVLSLFTNRKGTIVTEGNTVENI